jgi:hypothetical protein
MEAPPEIAVCGRIRWARKAARLGGRAMSGMPSSQSAVERPLLLGQFAVAEDVEEQRRHRGV